MSVYLLSVLDGAHSTVNVFAWLFVFSTGILCFFCFAPSPDRSTQELEEHKRLCHIMRISAILLFIFASLSFLIPSHKSLIASYMMLEGRKVVTAENIDKIADVIQQTIKDVIKEKTE